MMMMSIVEDGDAGDDVTSDCITNTTKESDFNHHQLHNHNDFYFINNIY